MRQLSMVVHILKVRNMEPENGWRFLLESRSSWVPCNISEGFVTWVLVDLQLLFAFRIHWKIKIEPTNHPFFKINISSKPPWLCSMSIFRGVLRSNDKHHGFLSSRVVKFQVFQICSVKIPWSCAVFDDDICLPPLVGIWVLYGHMTSKHTLYWRNTLRQQIVLEGTAISSKRALDRRSFILVKL